LNIFVRSGRASLAHLRGDPAGGAELHQQLLADITPWKVPGWCSFHTDYVMALNDAQQFEKAKAMLGPLRARVRPEDKVYSIYYARPDLELAIAEAGLGNFPRAVALVEAVLEAEASGTNPRFMGTAHAYRARVALMMEDAESFRHHHERMAHWFAMTDNPSLLRKVELLAQQAIRQKLVASLSADMDRTWEIDAVTAVQTELGQCADAGARHVAALRLLQKSCGGDTGWLYLARQQELSHAAGDGQAPESLRAELRRLLQEAAEAEDESEITQTSVATPDMQVPAGVISTIAEGETAPSAYVMGLLRSRRTADGAIVGGVIMRGGDGLRPLRRDLLFAIAEQLPEATG
jgi:hypothetical protein